MGPLNQNQNYTRKYLFILVLPVFYIVELNPMMETM